MLSNFTPQDISCASHLTKLTWGDEMALTNDGLKDVLYEAMVRYYYRSGSCLRLLALFVLQWSEGEGVGQSGGFTSVPVFEHEKRCGQQAIA